MKEKEENNISKQSEEISAKPTEIDRVPTNEEYNRDLKQRMESDLHGKIINWGQLIEIEPDFAHWLQTIVSYRDIDDKVLIYWKPEKNRFRCFLYTNDNRYTISGVVPSKDKPKGYLGAGVSNRKPDVGEDWTRGADLPDGSFSKETFDAIVRKIIAFELKSLQLWR